MEYTYNDTPDNASSDGFNSVTPLRNEEYYKNINKRCGCLNLRKAARAATQLFDHILEPAGVRATQFTLLIALSSVSAKTLTEMAATLVMDRTTLTRNLKPLEKMGLIASVSLTDRRSRGYSLTEKGRHTLEIGMPLWEQAQQQLVSGLGDDRFNNLVAELKEVTNKIIDLS